jgi:hypothetical protein
MAMDASKELLRTTLLNYRREAFEQTCGRNRSAGPASFLYVIDNPSERLGSLTASLDALVKFSRVLSLPSNR